MWSRLRVVLPLAFAAIVVACAGAPRTPAPAPQPAPAPAPPRDEATAAAIAQVLAGEHRSAENRARDLYQHPLETLLFFGIKPDMTVAEVWPGAGGWYTEILAPLLAAHGKLYAAQMPPAADNPYITAARENFTAKLASRPDLFARVTVTALGPGAEDIAPPGSADLVVSFGNLHAWMNLGYAPQAIAAMRRALKPDGILGIVDNRGDPARPQDPRATNGYINEAYAIRLIEAAGFELVGHTEVNSNPKDSKDYEQGVWTLPPNYRLGARERAKYEAIGEADRFTLRFRKKTGS